MTDPMEVVEKLCERYQTAVSNNDSDAYSKLFAEDAIRIPPGSEPEHGPDDPPWKRLRGPNQWPAALPTMAPTVLRWMAAMDDVGITALRALAVGLGLPMDHFDHGFLPESDVHLKIIRYPSSTTDTGDGQGVGLHSDTGLLTFIPQDEVGGLQVEIGGERIDAPARPGMYLMNLGEMLETATDGYLKATPHRVVSPPAGRERISIAYFFNPRFELPFERVELPGRELRQLDGDVVAVHEHDAPAHPLLAEIRRDLERAPRGGREVHRDHDGGVERVGRHSAAFTVMTGHGASRTVRSAVLPSSTCFRPVSPRVPMTMRSAPSSPASSAIRSGGSPSTTCAFTRRSAAESGSHDSTTVAGVTRLCSSAADRASRRTGDDRSGR